MIRRAKPAESYSLPSERLAVRRAASPWFLMPIFILGREYLGFI